MPSRYYSTPDGVSVTPALSLAGSYRGCHLLDVDMSPPVPAATEEINTAHGVWRRCWLVCDVKGAYSSEDRRERVRAWVRV